MIARGGKTHGGEGFRRVTSGASVALTTGAGSGGGGGMSFLGLSQKQTLRQGFENKQSQEKLVGNRGVRQRKEGAFKSPGWDAFMMQEACYSSTPFSKCTLRAQLSYLELGLPYSDGRFKKMAASEIQTDSKGKCWRRRQQSLSRLRI